MNDELGVGSYSNWATLFSIGSSFLVHPWSWVCSPETEFLFPNFTFRRNFSFHQFKLIPSCALIRFRYLHPLAYVNRPPDRIGQKYGAVHSSEMPMPVSETEISKLSTLFSLNRLLSTVNRTFTSPPDGVNFTAFEIKFVKICFICSGSKSISKDSIVVKNRRRKVFAICIRLKRLGDISKIRYNIALL